MFQKFQTVGVFTVGIGVREMGADVGKPSGSKQRLTQSVRQHVAVGVANGAFLEWDGDSANNERAAFGQAMQVVTNAAADSTTFAHKRALMPGGPCRVRGRGKSERVPCRKVW